MKSRSILVTGGLGYIGSHACVALAKAGYRLVVVDNLSNGYRANLNPAAAFEEIDIAVDSERLTSVLHGREVVYLTAALARVPRSIEDPVGTHAGRQQRQRCGERQVAQQGGKCHSGSSLGGAR